MAPPRTIGVGVVGAGWMGQVHARAYARVGHHYPELPLRPVLRAVADPVASMRADAVARYGYEREYADWSDLVADPDIELVSVCTPPFLHAEVGAAVAVAGKHLWIEKPVGLSLADTTRVADAAAAAGVVGRVGFNYRQVPAVARARRLLEAGEIGRVTHANVRLLTDYAAHPLAVLSWRFGQERGGDGVVGDLLSHGIDLVHHLVGEVAHVVADSETFIDARPLPGAALTREALGTAESESGPVENADYLACLLRTTSGVPVFLEGSRAAVGDQNNYGFDVRGTRGRVSWDFRRPGELVVSSGGDYVNQPATTTLVGPGDGDYGRFQPGSGIAMGFDDTKVIECAGLLGAVAAAAVDPTEPRSADAGATLADALAAARVMEALRDLRPPWRTV